MAVDKLLYEQYDSEHAAINDNIANIEDELSNANKKLNEATESASGKWASADIEEWNQLYADINQKFKRLQDLMAAAKTSVEATSTTDNSYSGFNA